MEEEEGAVGEVEGNPSCEKEKEKKTMEKEKEEEKKSEEEEKEKEIEESEEQANGGGEECEGEVFLLENLGYRGYREDVLKDRLDPPQIRHGISQLPVVTYHRYSLIRKTPSL